GSRGISEPPAQLASRKPLRVDRDNFDQVMAKLRPELHLPIGDAAGTRIPIHFAELEDLHPDRLFQRLGLFEAWRDLRKRLGQPSTQAAAAAEVREWLKPAATPAAPTTSPPIAAVPAENLLEQILGDTPPEAAERPRLPGGGDWQAFLRKIVKPHVAPSEAPDRAELLSVVDETTSGQMRAILRHPDFQALEAAWRGLFLLVRRLETDTKLRLYVLDISKAELAADLQGADD